MGPQVDGQNNFSVHVYAERGGRHHLPHVHVRIGDEVTVVSLSTGDVIVGPALSRRVRRYVNARLNEYAEKWSELNDEQ